VGDKIELEAVGITDAAHAMVLAAERGRVGERYPDLGDVITNAEVVRIAAEAQGVTAPDQVNPAADVLRNGIAGTAKAKLVAR